MNEWDYLEKFKNLKKKDMKENTKMLHKETTNAGKRNIMPVTMKRKLETMQRNKPR